MANTIANVTATNGTQLQIFNNAEFGSIRTLDINGEPWLVGKDVAEALGYSNASKAVITHVDEEDRFKMMLKADSQNGNVVTETTVINESGLYSLIISSKLPTAKKFKHWVTAEVLPAIRKHGVYTSNITDVMGTPLSREEFAKFAYILRLGIGDFAAEIKNEVSSLAAIIKEQNDTYNKNMLQLLDKFSQTQTTISATEIKADHNDVNNWLRKAWKSAEIISAKSGKDKKRMLIEAYDIVRSGGTDLSGMYRTYKTSHPGVAMINMCAESGDLRAKMESALKSLNEKYAAKISVGESPTVKRQIYKSQLLQTTPPEVKKLINKISVKYSLPYNRAAMKAYTEIERLAGCDLTKDVKSFAAANGCSRASKAYYVGARAKYLDILRQIAEEV